MMHGQKKTLSHKGIIWASDQPDTDTSNWQHIIPTTNRHPCFRRDSNLQPQQASGRRPTP